MTDYFYPKSGPIRSKIDRRPTLRAFPRSFRGSLRWAFEWSLLMATGFSSLVLVKSLAQWKTTWPEYFGVTTWQIIATYYAAAFLVTPVLAFLRPITYWRWGTFLLGGILGMIFYGTVGLALGIHGTLFFGIAVIASLPMGGLALVIQDDERVPPQRTRPRFVLTVVTIGAALALLMGALGWW